MLMISLHIEHGIMAPVLARGVYDWPEFLYDYLTIPSGTSDDTGLSDLLQLVLPHQV
jgi:hypothetical protein